VIEGTCSLLELVIGLVTKATKRRVREEAFWALSNITVAGGTYHVISIVEHGAIDAFCSILELNNVEIILSALTAISKILRVGAESDRDYTRLVDGCGGLEKVERLQEHESDEVYRLAQGIIETYFGIDDEADTAPSPPSIISTTRQCLTQTDSTTSARSNIPSPIKLQVPGDRTVINFFRADEFVKVWTEQLLDHRAKVQAAMENNGEEIPNTILCDRISLSGESYTPDAAEVIASFLSEPFQDGLPIAFGIVEVDLSDMIASQLTDSGLKVLRTICDAFADSELVEVNLSENAIGEQGAESCMTVLNKPSLRRLSLCNNGLASGIAPDARMISRRDGESHAIFPRQCTLYSQIA
jgi:hypothetical protein